MKLTLILSAVLATAVIAVAEAPAPAAPTFDKKFDFGKLKTYAWVDGTRVKDESIHKTLIAAIELHLDGKGLSKVDDAAKADVDVAYHASVDQESEFSGFSASTGGWGGWRWGGDIAGGTAQEKKVQVGTLLIDILDPRTSTIVWRAMSSKTLDLKATPETRKSNILRATESMLKNFPPKPKSE